MLPRNQPKRNAKKPQKMKIPPQHGHIASGAQLVYLEWVIEECDMLKVADTKEEILLRVLGAGPQLARLGVRSIGLFGSFVRGEQTAASDVDLLVDFEPGQHTFDNFMDVSLLLEDLLGRKVDLVTRESLSPYIGPHILREVERVAIPA